MDQSNMRNSYYPEGELTINLPTSEDFAAFDNLIITYMKENCVPGLSFAISYKGKLVHEQCYGWATHGIPLRSHHLMRIASISKVLTAAAIMKLCENGALRLHDKVFGPKGLLPQYTPTVSGDRRILQIRVRHLLQHSGGWDREQAGDPCFWTHIGREMGVPEPVSQHTLITYMMGQKLQFTPGKMYAYSNLGYIVLGRVIEEVSGMSYEACVLKLLEFIGISRMQLGRTFREQAHKNEVEYFAGVDQQSIDSIYPEVGKVASPYGSYSMETGDSDGGWIACPSDLLTFFHALEGTGPVNLLKKETLKMMLGKPHYAKGSTWYGLGLDVSWYGKAWEHGGHVDGATSCICRNHHGYTWALLCNFWPPETDYTSLVEYGLSLTAFCSSSVNRSPATNRAISIKIPQEDLPGCVADHTSQGYSATWISGYKFKDRIFFNVIWVKGLPNKIFIDLQWTEVTKLQQELSGQGYVLKHIDVYKINNLTLNAVIFSRHDTTRKCVTKLLNINSTEVEHVFANYKIQGFVPKVICPFSKNNAIQLCILLEKSDNKESWYKTGMPKDTFEGELNKQNRYGHLLSYVKAYMDMDSSKVILNAVWTNPGPFHYTADFDISFFRTKLDCLILAETCMHPVCIFGYEEDGTHKYVMVCAKKATKNVRKRSKFIIHTM